MEILTSLVSIIYYLLVAAIVGVIIMNFIKTREWQRELLYIIVLIPFLLRLLRLK